MRSLASRPWDGRAETPRPRCRTTSSSWRGAGQLSPSANRCFRAAHRRGEGQSWRARSNLGDHGREEGGRSALRPLLALLALGLCLYTAGWIYRIYLRQYYIWLPDYARWSLRAAEPATKPVHVILIFASAFEPGRDVSLALRWEREYPLLARRHRDNIGRPLQHTAFYPGDDLIVENLLSLQRLASGGYGEVELHLHHFNDTPQSALLKYRKAIEYFQTFGFLKTIDGQTHFGFATIDGQTHFGFAHGNSGLDNSLGSRACGLNQELRLLQELGCFADFTFPAIGLEAQPSIINTIYQAVDDERPKSYDRGTPLRLGQAPGGGIVIFPGPLIFTPDLHPKRLFVYLENGEIHPTVPVTKHRVDSWVRANIHVQGRSDWVFVRISGHLVSSPAEMDEALGPILIRCFLTWKDAITTGSTMFFTMSRLARHTIWRELPPRASVATPANISIGKFSPISRMP